MGRRACFIFIAVILVCGESFGQGHPCKHLAPEWISLGVTETPATAQTVNWRSEKGSTTGRAQITLANPSPNLELQSRTVEAVSELHNDYGSEKMYHRVTFSELKPDTHYVYRVGSDDCWSEWFQFKTANSSAAPFSFLYFGDVQYNIVSLFSRVIRQAIVQAPESSLMMFTGDLVTNATEAEFDEFFQAGDWMLASRVVAPIPDGHEYPKDVDGKRHNLSTFWNHAFAYPDNVPKEIAERGSYYFDYQNTRFIMLNNYDLLTRRGGVYIQWLESLLSNNPQKWTVVAHHHPVYPISAHRKKSSFYDMVTPLYDKYAVDLVLTGHDHGYSRGGIDLGSKKRKAVRGPVYVISVAGPGMYALAFRDWYDRVASNTQMFQHITMGDHELSFQAYTATGQLYDQFVIKKKKNGIKTFIDQAPAVVEHTDMPPGWEKRLTAEQLEEIETNRQRHLNRNK